MKRTTCENCGKPLPKGCRRWCRDQECIRAKEKMHKKQMRDYWKAHGGTRRIPDALKPPFNKKPCRLCKRPLGKTWNKIYHTECHKKASHVWCGVEE